jgi:phage shock protein E
MSYLIKYKIYIIGAILGAIAGYCYYYFVGCSNGTCAITSKPINSTLYGIMMGILLADILKKRKN